jgi:hypothetical protein
MLKFLEGLLDNADSIAYGAGTELYNKMVQDTEDRHRKFTMWGDQLQNDLNERKKNLQLEEGNYNKIISNIKTRLPEGFEIPDGLTIDEYLKPLDGQLGTGMFLGDEKEIMPRLMYFLKNSPIEKDTPYVPSENYFEQNFDKIDNQMQNISGMGYNTWRALSKKGELSMVDDTKPVEFGEEDKMNVIANLAVTAKNFDMWYPAGSPQQEQYAMFAKYLLIKNEAAKKATGDTGEINLINARAFENEMISSQKINMSMIESLFPGVDEATIRQISINGNPYLATASSTIDMIAGTSDPEKVASLQMQAMASLQKAVDFAIQTDKRFKQIASGEGQYEVSDVQNNVVRKLRLTLPENFKEVFSEMKNAHDGQGSNAQWHGYGQDLSGNGKINYAYTKMDTSGIRTWYMVDSNGVEIRTNLTEKDIRKEDGMDAVYKAVNNDILSQIQTGVVNYTDQAWAQTVAKQLGYQWDPKTGRVISVRERDASKLSDALYHGFATTPIGSKEVTESDQFDDLVKQTVY